MIRRVRLPVRARETGKMTSQRRMWTVWAGRQLGPGWVGEGRTYDEDIAKHHCS